MLTFTKKVPPQDTATSVSLPLDLRVRSRLRVTLSDGREAGIILARGDSLQDGDHLASSCGEIVRVQAAAETLSTVRCEDPLLLARACYHLGNRHVPVQIEANRLAYQHDHVLDDMLRGLGFRVHTEKAPFEPESGAYGHGHKHDQQHGHAHAH